MNSIASFSSVPHCALRAQVKYWSVRNHASQTCAFVSYQPERPPPCSRLPASWRGRRRRQCTTPTRTHTRQMKCYEGQERSPDLLQEDEKKKSVGGVAPTSQPDRDEREKVKKCLKNDLFLVNLPGLHLRVRIVWILVFLLLQKLPSVYTSLMSFPILVFWGDERKLPRLMAWWFLSGDKTQSINFTGHVHRDEGI